MRTSMRILAELLPLKQMNDEAAGISLPWLQAMLKCIH